MEQSGYARTNPYPPEPTQPFSTRVAPPQETPLDAEAAEIHQMIEDLSLKIQKYRTATNERNSNLESILVHSQKVLPR